MREPQGRWVAGVCTGLAENLGWPLALVRMTFLVLALANGLGVIAYLAFWAVLPLRRDQPRDRNRDFLRMMAFGVFTVALAIIAYAWGWGIFRNYAAPLLVLGVGLALLWQQWSANGHEAPEGVLRWLRPLLGVGLVAAGVIALLVGEVGWIQGVRALVVILLLAGGAALLALPWLVGMFRDLERERSERIHERARAELAAQVHDSVLQTLTLIQANAHDSDQVMRLARREERRLRSWLYAPVGDERGSLAAALQHVAARVEHDHGATIDVVQVGDAVLDEHLEVLVAATGEAMVNAAKHAGPSAAVSVYCEVDGGAVEVFVRDRGPGFDLVSVPADRHGVRDSIIARVQRIGGTAEVVSSASGTEVRLSCAVAVT